MKRVGTIIGWIATVLLVLSNGFATVMKFVPVEPGSQAELMGSGSAPWGLSAASESSKSRS